MGGMPMLEVGNWLHQVNGLYLTLIPCYVWLNNFVGPKVMEPVFTKDFLISQFEKIGSTSSAASGSVAGAAEVKAFVPTPGKAPVLPKNMFARGGIRSRAVLSFASIGLLAMVKPRSDK